jgi:hypothetical protein
MDQPTPLLRWDRALLKLELLSARGSVFGRVAQGFRGESVAASGNEALALARPGLRVALLGVVTHEMRETLKIWEASVVAEAPPSRQDPSVYARSLGSELAAQLEDEPLRIVAPAGAAAALLGSLAAVRGRWPKVRGVAMLASDEELPDLPGSAELPDAIEQVRITRAFAAKARAAVARELGLLAGHAGSAAAVYAREHGGVALVTSAGEREFSLDGTP